MRVSSHVLVGREVLKSAMMKFLAFLTLFITRAEFLGIVSRSAIGSHAPLVSATSRINRRHYLVWEERRYLRTYEHIILRRIYGRVKGRS